MGEAQNEGFFKSRVWRLLAISAMATLLLFITALLLSGRILKPLVHEAIRDQFVVPVEIETLGVSLWPRPGFHVQGLLVPDHSGDTLLYMRELYLQLRLWPLLRQRIEIPAVSLSEASIKLKHTKGVLNLTEVLAPQDTGSKKAKYQLDIQKLLCSDVHFRYFDEDREVYALLLDGAKWRWTLDEPSKAWQVSTEMYIDKFNGVLTHGPLSLGPMIAEGDFQVKKSLDSFDFEGLQLSLAEIDYDTQLELTKNGRSWHWKEHNGRVRGSLKKIDEVFGAFLPKDIRQLSGDVTVDFSGDDQSGIRVQWVLEDAGFSYGEKALRIDQLDGSGTLHYSNRTGAYVLDPLIVKGRYEGDPWLFSGNGKYRKTLQLTGSLEGTVKAKHLPEIAQISWRDGRIAADLEVLDLDFSNPEWPVKKAQGKILAEEFSWEQSQRLIEIDGLTEVSGSGLFRFEDISLMLDREKLQLAGSIERMRKNSAWRYELELRGRSLRADSLLALTAPPSVGSRPVSNTETAAFEGSVKIELDRLQYRDASLDNIRGTFEQLTGGIRFEGQADAFEGELRVVLDKPSKLPGVLDLRLDKIELQQCLQGFRNFDQDFLTFEQVKGRATALATVHLDGESSDWSKGMHVDVAVQIDDGNLRDMTLLEHFAGIARLSELRNLHFSRLTNVFQYRDGTLYIPAMRIESNVADLAITGRHSTGAEFLYDLRLNASGVLARKLKKRHQTPNTSNWLELFYHIEGQPEDWIYRADKKEVQNALDGSDVLRVRIIEKLRLRYGPHPLLLRSAQWRDIPE